MGHLRALWRLSGVILHALRGLAIVRLRFPGWADAQREQAVQAWAARMLQILGVRLETVGAAPAAGPVLLVCNHVSWLDIVVMHAARYCRFVSKADVHGWPLVGTLATAAGTLYIERASRRDALRVVHHMAERLQAGDVLAVFPEGTTSDGRSVLPFHANLIQAPLAVDAPVQPLALDYRDPQTGQRTLVTCYVGDDTLVSSLWRTLRAPGVVARVRWGQAQTAQGRDRRAWAADLQSEVTRLRGD